MATKHEYPAPKTPPLDTLLTAAAVVVIVPRNTANSTPPNHTNANLRVESPRVEDEVLSPIKSLVFELFQIPAYTTLQLPNASTPAELELDQSIRDLLATSHLTPPVQYMRTFLFLTWSFIPSQNSFRSENFLVFARMVGVKDDADVK
eukprot:CAMPEP_0118644650 /NCGR_PEP_ID=MMETSP0785-20121206/7061_1 /TAXON_ID=91992 /ORGANISM="Bolidomonas pacifica, Strain CCMP 1866" /LENGTH=147 /DNA_ID=CAMNT_0006536441 /DNA_START=29 /DNA_END=473 /DNA_ORIENTATION=+